jgi:hypothetical protein
MDKKIIFWDMDRTLGFFDHLAYGKLANQVPECIENDFGLKDGIEGLIKDMSAKGFIHYVTTSARNDYATEALKVTGIDRYFSKVFTRESLCEDLGFGHIGPKNYKYPLRDIKMDLEQSKSDVLIVGNSFNDAPYNADKIVSIIDKDQWMRASTLLDKMIKLLMDEGNGDFNKGFQKIYAGAEKIEPAYKHLSKIGKIFIEDDVELHLRFLEERERCSRAPILCVVKADNYYKKIEAKR